MHHDFEEAGNKINPPILERPRQVAVNDLENALVAETENIPTDVHPIAGKADLSTSLALSFSSKTM